MKQIIIENLKMGNTLSELNYYITLIPKPNEYELGINYKIIDSGSSISFGNIERDFAEFLLKKINARLEEYNKRPLKFNDKESFQDNNKIEQNISELELEEFQKQQCYNLVVNENKCIISAKESQGIFYGVQTLIQLIDITDEKKLYLPEIEIFDYPILEIRGISDDITRGQVPTVDNVKRLIQLLSHFKMNFYFIGYETEFLENEKHPLITKGKAYLTKEEVKELEKYAKKHFIEFVPFFQVLGHYDNILALEKYMDLGEFPGAMCLNIKDDEVYDFLEDIIKNVSKTFDSDYIHVGGDESWDFGKYKSKEIVEKKGKGRAYLDHYKWVYNRIKKYNKKQMFLYHDIVVHEKEFLEDFPKDVIMFFWKYFTSWKFKYRKAKKLKKYGFPVVVSPTIYNWSRHYPDFKWAEGNILSIYRFAKNNNLKGGITSQWGDYGHEDLRVNHYYGYILSAGALWSNIDRKYFKKAYSHQYFGCKLGETKIIEVLETLCSINDHFSKLPPKFFVRFWEHPFLRRNPKIKLKKYQKVEKKANETLDLLKEARYQVNRHKSDLDYIDFATKLAKFIAIKFKSSYNIGKTLLGSNVLENDSIRNGMIKLLKTLKKTINNLKKIYENLWLRCAKRDGLNRLLEKYDILNFYYQKKLDEITREINWRNPNHPAKWITYPNKAPFQQPRYYRKTFEIKDLGSINECYLQAIASHYLKIYFNEEYLGYVITRNSLSYVMMEKQVRVFEISDHLKEGRNVIAIESCNYISQHEGINIYLEIFKNNNIREIILSDESWKTMINSAKNWKDIDFSDHSWENAKSLGKSPKFNGRIIRPYLKDGYKSTTTYLFAIRGMIESFLPSFLKPFIGLAMKLLNIE
ncbi:MAG: family 20 glycosylhydrolase [Candidatus Lokiarchaeota archaeon]|nr:family 20 glycosylhydrolase [Candidatus Lokiarchaeota archaeon]